MSVIQRQFFGTISVGEGQLLVMQLVMHPQSVVSLGQQTSNFGLCSSQHVLHDHVGGWEFHHVLMEV